MHARTRRPLAAALLVLLALVALPAAAPAKGKAKPKHKTTACHGRQVRVVRGKHHVCVKASAPARDAAAQQRAFDRALLASRLRPRKGHGHGRTIGAWLGSARAGVTALERALAGAPAAHSARASASAKGWKTSTTDRTPADTSGSALEIVTRRGKAKLTLDSSYVAKVEHCADAAGADPGTRTRKIAMTLVVPLAGGRTLTVKSTQSTTTSFVGTANDAAALDHLVLGKIKTKASSKAELRDKHDKLLARLSPTGATATITVPTVLGTTVAWPAVLTDPATAFVVSGALKELFEGDSSSSLDPLLRRFVLDMQTDAWSTYDQARGALLDAQTRWWQAGRCLHIVLETPSGDHVVAGGHLPLRATAVLTSAPKKPQHPGVGPLPMTAAATAGAVAPAAATTAATGAGQADPLVFDYTAPAAPGTPTATVAIVSKQGTATASVPLTVTSGDVYLKVTGISGGLDYTASYTDGNPASCAVSGVEHKTASLDPDGHLGATDGRYHDGSLSLNVPVYWNGTRDYTASSINGMSCAMAPTCHVDISEPGGPIAGGIATPGAATVDVDIVAPTPNPYAGCMAGYKDPYWLGGTGTISTAVPIAAITAGRPFTISWQSSAAGEGRTVSRRLTATVTPVRADGSPLG